MGRKFSEIVIEGPFMMVKGFLLGFLACKKPKGKYFFHRKENIRRETLKEFVKELFELENYVHLCLEDELIEPFKQVVDLYTKKTGYVIKSIKPIKGAAFSFAAEIFEKDMGSSFKQIVEHLPEGVSLKNYTPSEIIEKDAKGFESYAPLHEYIFRAKGEIEGDFEGVIDTYMKIKRSDLNNFVICSEIKLEM
ncbi:hypothetical protein Calab_1328 [Caldithrix abyssi DSM 13497]|uniref:Uncharacterized protein n=1 Tax=Caldithrix abyssi DSM 13497 TaxID=880073 RepID=H1XYT3_CALAY|nr:hypothetical protein [Caldithrix abyssi]APF20533.1 hypothetical protein Cabys_3788 [Caldithrix abyssi DSM 13497]EHO40952.1 hypothetical protein Calab_1328 [Caldithrix abyssi DSM 13497]